MIPKRITLRDVARQLGVSHATVSLSLRNHPRISVARRQEVLRVVKEMGYVPDPLFSQVAAYRQNRQPAKIHSSIAWVNHWDQPERLIGRHKEFASYWKGASEAALERGYRVDEIRWPADCSARRFEQILFARGIRGMLIPPHPTPPDWDGFDWNKFSIIRFGLSVQTPDSNIVTSDQYRAMMMAITKIHGYGYRRIGLVVGSNYDLRLGGAYQSGFQWAQHVLQLEVKPPALVVRAEETEPFPEAEKRALKQWLTRHHPDAILTSEIRLPALIRELGQRIPEEVAVAGTSCDVPVEAGINQNSEAIGRIAVEMLLKQINFNECGEPAAPCRMLIESFWQDGRSLPRRPKP
jgi:DNA-binding LacI/PurR family transcriptional regulator